MAYYSGQAADYNELRSVLISACTSHGWTSHANSIISNDNNFVQLDIVEHNPQVQRGGGLVLKGGTGLAGSTVANPSPVTPRLGNISQDGSGMNLIFPVLYNIHIFDGEVFLVIKYNVDRFQYIAFGGSENTHYLAATTQRYLPLYGSFFLTEHGSSSSNWQQAGSAFFYDVDVFSGEFGRNTAYHDGVWSNGGINNQNQVSAFPYFQGLIDIQPNAWNQESIFLPFHIFKRMAENKLSIIYSVENARFIRIDNFEPEQIITLGTDRWKVYPFHRKSTASRDGGNGIDHSGTFGWAIKYDGP